MKTPNREEVIKGPSLITRVISILVKFARGDPFWWFVVAWLCVIFLCVGVGIGFYQIGI